jgi:hypothetical protein
MDYDVIEARAVRDHVVWLRFQDGSEGEVDLSSALYGPVFEPLRDVAYFQTFKIDANFKTLTWPNGADFAPEFLHEQVRSASIG